MTTGLGMKGVSDRRVGGENVMSFFVYIIASRRNGALYVDVARDLAERGCPRRERAQPGFARPTRRRGTRGGRDASDVRDGDTPADDLRVVYYEEFATVLKALSRERVIRTSTRDWKIRRIESMNPDWQDLSRVPARAPDRAPDRAPEALPAAVAPDRAADRVPDRVPDRVHDRAAAPRPRISLVRM